VKLVSSVSISIEGSSRLFLRSDMCVHCCFKGCGLVIKGLLTLNTDCCSVFGQFVWFWIMASVK
jgi:hypothetical protein